MHNRIHFTDVSKELVTKTFPLACAAHKPGDIYEFKRRRHGAVRHHELSQLVEPLVRHFHYADVRVDGAERIVRGFGTCLRDRIKQCRFADIRQTHDSCF
ncbi:hypothetical protein D3C72_691070 [compost metagenome]